MAYDPQANRRRPKPTEKDPAPVDALLGDESTGLRSRRSSRTPTGTWRHADTGRSRSGLVGAQHEYGGSARGDHRRCDAAMAVEAPPRSSVTE